MRDRTGLYEIEPVPDELGGGSVEPPDRLPADPDQTELIPPEPLFE